MKTKEDKTELMIEAWLDGVDMDGLIDYARHNLEKFYARCSDEEIDQFFLDSGLEKPEHEIKYGEDHED